MKAHVDSKILIVDDEPEIMEMLTMILSEEGYVVCGAESGEQALGVLERESIDLVITDNNMPSMDGLSLLKEIKQKDADIEVIVLTGYASVESAISALGEGGAFNYLTKPLESLDSFFHAVNKALENRSLRLENKKLVHRLEHANAELEERVTRRTAELREANSSLLKAKENAELGEISKKSFLASISHELRTPLSAVIGFTQLLLIEPSDCSPEKLEKYLKIILQNGEKLLALIEDVIDFSQLDVTGATLNLAPIPLASFFGDCLGMIEEGSIEKRVRIRLYMDEFLKGLEIPADTQRLRHAIFNILDNALKSTPERGTIELHVRAVEQDGSMGGNGNSGAPQKVSSLQISIQDSGSGVSAEEQEKIFEPFYQINSGLTGKDPGVGLGLTLAKRFIEQHGGSIRVQSTPGEGATFTIALPIPELEL